MTGYAAALPIPPLNVSPEQAAAILGVSRSRVYDLLSEGTIISIKDGKRRLIPVVELERFKEMQEQQRRRTSGWRDRIPALNPESVATEPELSHDGTDETEDDDAPNGPDAQLVRTIYFIQPVGGGPIKVGIASNLAVRFQAIQANSPLPLEVIATARGNLRAEQRIHHQFAQSRLHGEWFEPTPQLLAFIEQIKGTNL